jgi:FCP1-like phosphatase family protein
MHVYTMGTRAYAEEVCAAIDPEGTIFGGRLLSRDESGSLTQKSLQRLFPCDTSMVVIIDDRADVWEWSTNLVKVVPCKSYANLWRFSLVADFRLLMQTISSLASETSTLLSYPK